MNMEQNEFETTAREIRPRIQLTAVRYLQNKETAEDIAQEVLLKLWQMRKQLEQYRSVEALAIVVTKHLCLNTLRKQSLAMTDSYAEEEINGISPEEEYIGKEAQEQLFKALDSLPDVQQATLRMKTVDGLEVSEIARLTGCEEVTVRANLSRARKKILNYFV